MRVLYFFLAQVIFISINSAQIKDKIDIKLLQANNDKMHNAVIILNEQADLSAVANIKGKEAKTSYVFNKLVATADSCQKEVLAYLAGKDIPHRSYYIVNMISIKTDINNIKEIATLSSVKSIIEDGNFKMHEVTEDRNPSGNRTIEWNVTHINAPNVWALGFTGQNVVIGGQDTGYEWNDATLINKYRGWNGSIADHNYDWHDAIYANNTHNTGTNPCGYNLAVPCDDNNHGTHTMGTMVGDDGVGNQIGIAPGAKWIGCRNMERGWGTLTTYTECFEWFLAPYAYGATPASGDPTKMPHVINNSWGCPTDEGCNTTNFAVMETALNNLRNAGCVIVVSAGNSGSNCSTVNDPAAIFNGSFSVGATNSSDVIAGFSSRGPVTVDGSNRLKPNISAPGVSVRSCINGVGNYASYNGTSMAGPHVAGLIALLISANPKLEGEVDKIEDIIEQTAIHITSTQTCGSTSGSNIPNNTFGYGRIDALAAVNMALVSAYTPLVKYSNDMIINAINSGIVLTNTNNQKYRLTVDNSGNILINSIPTTTGTNVVVNNSSVEFSRPSNGMILRSPNDLTWKLTVTSAGNPITTLVSSLPPNYTSATTGDIILNTGQKGMILKDNQNNCYLINITTLGSILAIPTNCP